jgi:hypothetical protein
VTDPKTLDRTMINVRRWSSVSSEVPGMSGTVPWFEVPRPLSVVVEGAVAADVGVSEIVVNVESADEPRLGDIVGTPETLLVVVGTEEVPDDVEDDSVEDSEEVDNVSAVVSTVASALFTPNPALIIDNFGTGRPPRSIDIGRPWAETRSGRLSTHTVKTNCTPFISIRNFRTAEGRDGESKSSSTHAVVA